MNTATQDSDERPLWPSLRLVLYAVISPWFVAILAVRWLPRTEMFCIVLGAAAYEFWLGALARQIVKEDREGTHDQVDVTKYQPLPHGGIDAAAGRVEWLCNMLDRLQQHINDEYGNIAARTGWLLTGQAFLLGAFVAILNSDHLNDETTHWLSAGVAATGAVISCVLLVSTYLGHGLAGRIKTARDAVERTLAEEFGMARAGVPAGHVSQKIGGYATRYLPTFAYIAWIFLTVLACANTFVKGPPVRPTATAAAPAAAMFQGWVRYPQLSPPFPIGEADYAKPAATRGGRSDCEDNTRAAQLWAEQFVDRWRTAKRPVAAGLILVGSADRVRLSAALGRRMDSNVALARARAETIKELLRGVMRRTSPNDTFADDRVMVLVTGPTYEDTPAVADCRDPRLAVDRSVQVWMPASE